MSGEETTPDAAIEHLKSKRPPIWTVIRWIRRRRPVLTAIIVLAAPAHTLLTESSPVNLLAPRESPRAIVAWALMLLGFGIRLWGSGMLRKSQEITSGGVYAIVRHPLYLGSLCLFLAYFLTVGSAPIGTGLFLVLAFLVYFPTMLAEEEYLTLKFPEQFSRYRPPPRFLPDLRRLPEALRTDRFSWRSAYYNLGIRGLWFLIGLPVFLLLLRWLDARIGA